MALHGDYTNRQTFIQDGKEYAVVTNTFGSGYTVKDEAGNPVRYEKNGAILKFREEREAERDKIIAHYEKKAKYAGLLKQDLAEKIKELWQKMSGLDENDKEHSILKAKYWEARFARVSASNQEYSAYMNAFMVASDPII